jgi:iron complex outermembrane receptor protein
MRSKIWLAAFCLLVSFRAVAQFSISGTITDQVSGQSLAGASVRLENTFKASTSDHAGHYRLSNLSAGSYLVKVSYIGYETLEQTVDLQSDFTLDLRLEKKQVLADEVIVTATQATDKSALAYTNLNRAELSKQNLGQDLPLLLNLTPSAVTTSDAGAGVGYTGIRIRGSDATRVNVTINGVPYNDAESQGSFFVNLPDLASSVNSIQIQRGVGTSTNGPGAFGASLNIQTNQLRKEAYAEVNNTFGSFNTWKHTAMVGTGLINGHFTFDGRLSKIASDGYIDRSSSDLKSFYLSGGYYGKNTILRLNVFSGQEKTYQAWNGVPESLLSTNRRYNSFTYDNQTDNYQQDHYQLHFSQELGAQWQFNTSLFYTRGKGYYEELKEQQPLLQYGIANLTIRDSTIKESDLIRRLWLDNHFYGSTFSLNYDSQGKLTANFGGGWNQYRGKHYGEVVWARVASNSNIRQRYYENDAKKTDFNLYAKAFYQLFKPLNAFVDLQVRTVGYSFLGYNRQLENVQQSVGLTFFNPKFGLTYTFNDQSHVYASYSIGNKEPNRNDFTQSSPESRPKSETLRNLEAGYRLQTSRFSLSANYYLMDYRNQLVLTGQINDVGGYNRTNIASSYRTGVEVEAGVRLLKNLRWNANTTISANKVRNFTEFVDDYDNGGQLENVYGQTDIPFSPNVIVGSQLTLVPVKNLELSVLSKYVGKQYLDNTSNESRKLNPYFTNDLRINYVWKTQWLKEINLGLLLNNAFNALYESNGYTFSYISEGQLLTENYYFPQAGRNFLLSVGLKF